MDTEIQLIREKNIRPQEVHQGDVVQRWVYRSEHGDILEISIEISIIAKKEEVSDAKTEKCV
jgi:hypothetical protein